MKESGSAADIIHSYCATADVCMGATVQSQNMIVGVHTGCKYTKSDLQA
jgi:hypothetical protein